MVVPPHTPVTANADVALESLSIDTDTVKVSTRTGSSVVTMVATDDAHFSEPDHFGGWVMVKSEANAPEALLSALKRGDFYSSQGPELRDVRLEGDKMIVESSAVSSVIVQGWGTGAKGVHGHSMTRTEVPLARLLGSPWLRVTVIDAAGKRAWSNPMWREEGENLRRG